MRAVAPALRPPRVAAPSPARAPPTPPHLAPDPSSGGGGARDVHLENFSVSNGGKELIENGNVMFAFGRRYGLVGLGWGVPLLRGGAEEPVRGRGRRSGAVWRGGRPRTHA
jgi:hypothetical protein